MSNQHSSSETYKKGGYQKKGGTQQTQGSVPSKQQEHPSTGAQPGKGNYQQQQQQQQQYVKKTTKKNVQDHPVDQPVEQIIAAKKEEPVEQVIEEKELTVVQKFDQLFGIGTTNQVQDVKQVLKLHDEAIAAVKPKLSKRRRFDKESLLTKFQKADEIDTKIFEKDCLKFIDLFSSNSLIPENVISLDPHQPDISQLQAQSKRPYNKGQGKPQWRGPPGSFQRNQQEEEEEEEDPEWVDFDPKKESGSFFGRAIPDEIEIRDQVKKDKERTLQAWGGGRKQSTDDQFERLVKQEREEALKKAQIDKELAKKVEVLAEDLEHNERNYSDIDMIFEKNAKAKKVAQSSLTDDQLESLFNSLSQDSKPKEVKKEKEPKVAEQPKQPQVVEKQKQPDAPLQQQSQQQLPQNLQQQLLSISQQQKQQLQYQKLVQQKKPKFTALQNVQNLFQGLPVVIHEKHRIKMEEIAKLNYQEAVNHGQLFKDLMSSINPFAKYIINECQQGLNISYEKYWTLEDSIFQKPTGVVSKENLMKTSSEMFVIYKYFSDPLTKVKSEKYTQDQFVQIKDLFDPNNLLQTSPLNVQLSQLAPQMMMNQQQLQYMQAQQQAMRQQYAYQQKMVAQQQQQQQQKQQQQQHSQQQENQPPQQQNVQNIEDALEQQKQQEKQTAEAQQQNPSQRQIIGNKEKQPHYVQDDEEGEYEEPKSLDLSSMEYQLKNLLGFQPR